jgi:NitT/TauT family transport system substrate-binding protein
MRHKLYIWPAAAIALAAAFLPAPPAVAQSRAKITEAQAGDGFQFLTQKIAVKAGFFAQEGYDLDVADVGSGPRVVAALMGGSAVYSPLGLINLLNARSQGGELVGIAAESNLIDMQLVLSNAALAKTGIDPAMPIDEKVKRLRDLRISVTSPGSSTDTMLRTLLRARKIDPDQVLKIIPTGGGSNMLAAMTNNANDGFIWGAPQTLMAVNSGVGKIVIDPFKGEVPEVQGVPYIVITTAAETVKTKPDMLRATVRALTRAMKLAHDDPAGAKRIVRSAFPEMDDAIFDQAWTNYVKAIPDTPVVSSVQFDKTKDWLNLITKKPLAVRYEDSIVASFAKQAAAELLKN